MQNKSNSGKTALSKANAAKTNAAYVWKQLEDVVVPRLHLSVIERAIYYYLLRHSRLEGKLRHQFSIASLGRQTHLSPRLVRRAIHDLVAQGALRLIRRSYLGYLVEVRVPEEIRASRFAAAKVRDTALRNKNGKLPAALPLAEIDFLQSRELRQAIHAREGGRCFYCLRRLATSVKTLDHVVPRSLSGGNSYLNLVSACVDCNSQKGEKRAEDFLRWLYRERRLTAAELSGRVRALKALLAAKLRPAMQEQEK